MWWGEKCLRPSVGIILTSWELIILEHTLLKHLNGRSSSPSLQWNPKLGLFELTESCSDIDKVSLKQIPGDPNEKNSFTCAVKFRTKFLCSSLELYQISTSWTLRYRFKSWHVRIQCYVLSSHFNVIPFILSGLFWPETRLENNWNSFFFFWNSNWKINIY